MIPSSIPEMASAPHDVRRLRIVIGKDLAGWYRRLVDAFARCRDEGAMVDVSVANLDASDWIDSVRDTDVVVWKPAFMGPIAAAQFRSKIFFLEHDLGKLVVPNVATTWHFENKIAQHFVFEQHGVPTPRTTASSDYEDALRRLRAETFPIVVKEAHGAGSSHVHLVRSVAESERLVEARFAQHLWLAACAGAKSRVRAVLANCHRRWFWHKVLANVRGQERFPSIYWQRFVPGNDGDLRIAVIGDRYAYWFRRQNREGDFRASGSGRIRYEGDAPMDAIDYCIKLNARLGFDSMAYDLLLDGARFLICEMSFGYLDTAPYNAEGYFERREGVYEFVQGHYWPEELWARWTLERARRAHVIR